MAKIGTTKYLSNKQESRVAKELNAHTVIASGSLWGSKGDVRAESFLVECKTTEKTFYSLSTTVWDKIRVEATHDGLRMPVMCIDLESGKDRMAVFQHSRMIHYLENLPDVQLKSTQRTYRITSTPMTLHLGRSCLSVVPWESFVEYYSVQLTGG